TSFSRDWSSDVCSSDLISRLRASRVSRPRHHPGRTTSAVRAPRVYRVLQLLETTPRLGASLFHFQVRENRGPGTDESLLSPCWEAGRASSRERRPRWRA